MSPGAPRQPRGCLPSDQAAPKVVQGIAPEEKRLMGGSDTCNGTNFPDDESEYLRRLIKWRSDHPGDYMTETDRLRIFQAMGFHR